MSQLTPINFVKMHGAGNDFPVFDLRDTELRFTNEMARAAGDRRRGIGGDQVIIIEPSETATAFMRIFNHTGDEVEACGNATRCVAQLLMDETGQSNVTIETVAGILEAEAVGNEVRVNMGTPTNFRQLDSTHEVAGLSPLTSPGAIEIGNPHLVFAVEDAMAYPLEEVGPVLEQHEAFPNGCNVSLAEIRDDGSILLRVWERHAGITLACGSAACATLAVLNAQGKIGTSAPIDLPGGRLTIELREDGSIDMTGPTAIAYRGTWAVRDA